jgi:hypothetical protein
MKKSIFILFLSGLLILVPCCSAFTLPINTDEINHLETLVQAETNPSVQHILQTLIADIKESEGILNIATVETVLQDQLFLDIPSINESVLNTDAWQWIIDRLGWVYITADNVITLVEKGTAVFTIFSIKTGLVFGWFQSIVLIKETWQLFKNDPTTLSYLKDFINAVANAVTLTIAVVSDLTDGEQELITAFTEFQTELQDFSSFISNEPWNDPIIIFGSIDGIEDEATVSCNDQTVTTTENYTLSVPTESTEDPWWIHRLDITATYGTHEESQTTYAFSLGNVEADFDFSEDSIIHPLSRYSFRSLIQLLLSGHYSFIDVISLLHHPF